MSKSETTVRNCQHLGWDCINDVILFMEIAHTQNIIILFLCFLCSRHRSRGVRLILRKKQESKHHASPSAVLPVGLWYLYRLEALVTFRWDWHRDSYVRAKTHKALHFCVCVCVTACGLPCFGFAECTALDKPHRAGHSLGAWLDINARSV